jgi:hypothetical protein
VPILLCRRCARTGVFELARVLEGVFGPWWHDACVELLDEVLSNLDQEAFRHQAHHPDESYATCATEWAKDVPSQPEA